MTGSVLQCIWYSFCVVALAGLAAGAFLVDHHDLLKRRIYIGPLLFDALLVVLDSLLGCQEPGP